MHCLNILPLLLSPHKFMDGLSSLPRAAHLFLVDVLPLYHAGLLGAVNRACHQKSLAARQRKVVRAVERGAFECSRVNSVVIPVGVTEIPTAPFSCAVTSVP